MAQSDGVGACVPELGRSLVRTSIALFLASPLATVPGLLLLFVARRLCDAYDVSPGTSALVTGAALTIALAPLHLNLLSPLLAKRLLGARARRLLPATSILLVNGDGETWRLFAHASLVTAAAIAMHALWSLGLGGHGLGHLVMAMVFFNAIWLYRLVVITRR